MSDTDVYTRLAEHFPASAHKTKPSGGRELIYVDGEMVVSRLNEALGFDGWSFEVGQVNVLEDEVWVTGKLTVYSGDRVIVREQAGGQIINRTRGVPARPYAPADGDRPEQPAVPAQKGQIVELGNDIKGAITDCLKKCATLVGVGLYLFDAAERREVEQEMREAKRAPKPPAGKPLDLDAVRKAAQLTGAPPQQPATEPEPEPPGPEDEMTCVACKKAVPTDALVDIQRNPAGERRKVTVAKFAPICIERLGGFHCGPCYDRKHWKKGA